VHTSRALKGDFSNWQRMQLLFGDEYRDPRDWAGQLKHIALYSRTIGPEEALSQAAQLVQGHMDMYSRLSIVEEMESLPEAEEEPEEESVLDSSIDSLELSIRSMNCLKNANIRTLRDLVARGEKEMVEIRNFGEKSLKEVRDKLEVLGLGFGMNLDL
jgi:DNA-directed RNA polymerase subunit alpha